MRALEPSACNLWWNTAINCARHRYPLENDWHYCKFAINKNSLGQPKALVEQAYLPCAENRPGIHPPRKLLTRSMTHIKSISLVERK
jgi:hypothetical protein